jgi:hypothetical protein
VIDFGAGAEWLRPSAAVTVVAAGPSGALAGSLPSITNSLLSSLSDSLIPVTFTPYEVLRLSS